MDHRFYRRVAEIEARPPGTPRSKCPWRDQQTVPVRVNPVPGDEGEAREGHRHSEFARPALLAASRTCVQSTHPEVDRSQGFGVADAAVDHDPAPAVFDSERRQLVTDQCAPQGSTAVYDQDGTLDDPLEFLTDQHVVLVDPHRRDRTRERFRTETPQHWLGDLDQVWELVTQVSSRFGHGSVSYLIAMGIANAGPRGGVDGGQVFSLEPLRSGFGIA